MKLFDRWLNEKIFAKLGFPRSPVGLLKSHRLVLGHMSFSKPIIGKKNGITVIDLEQSFWGNGYWAILEQVKEKGLPTDILEKNMY